MRGELSIVAELRENGARIKCRRDHGPDGQVIWNYPDDRIGVMMNPFPPMTSCNAFGQWPFARALQG